MSAATASFQRAEIKKVDSRAFEIALANYLGESVRELEQMCRKSLRRYMPLMSTMCREGQLLPLKFAEKKRVKNRIGYHGELWLYGVKNAYNITMSRFPYFFTL